MPSSYSMMPNVQANRATYQRNQNELAMESPGTALAFMQAMGMGGPGGNVGFFPAGSPAPTSGFGLNGPGGFGGANVSNPFSGPAAGLFQTGMQMQGRGGGSNFFGAGLRNPFSGGRGTALRDSVAGIA